MKQTLLFSDLIGDIFSTNCVETCRFNDYMEEYLKNNLTNIEGLIFIDAPGLGNEEKYFDTILACFKRIDVFFKRTIYISKNSKKEEIDNFDRTNCIYFLMGGNPLAQFKIIIDYNLFEEIRDYEGLVIGFCAGAINLSQYSLITTDDDFSQSDYLGIGRMKICIDPCYNKTEEEEKLQNRNNEITMFVNKYNTELIGLPDKSIVIIENEKISEFGFNHHFYSSIIYNETL